MNPETRFTNKIRVAWNQVFPDIRVYKHSDRFNSGIADLHWIMPTGFTSWVEVKWIKRVVKRRKVNLSALQHDFLEEHADRGIPSFVVIGTGDGWAKYRIEDYDGNVYRKDMQDEIYLHELVEEVIHGGGNHFHG